MISSRHDEAHSESVSLYAVRALQSGELAAVEAQLSACGDCRRELEILHPVVDSFVAWPTDVLRPSPVLWERLARRIAADSGREPLLHPPVPPRGSAWEEAAPGIFYRLLGTDTATQRVTMLVRLAPGTDYPPHRHAGVEELHLLHGVLMVDDKRLHPGDYLRSDAGSVDRRVWSETGCTCVLMTSTQDALL
ncbi:MAG TPA: cupin domain-containing protein [Methylomirabilota bacterium]|jgi:anti-sigma factor ChrR (cupin superfamily)